MGTPDVRLTAFGNQLIEVHLWLREELASLREDIEAHGTGRLGELRAHCLTFCSALDRHHSGEDDDAFGRLARQFPELRPVVEELRRDHRLISDSLERLQTLLDADPPTLRREVDGLAAMMETHFVYEEKKIVSALNALTAPDWDRTRPAFRADAGARRVGRRAEQDRPG